MKTEQETETNTPPPTNGETAAVEESRRVRPKWLVPLVAAYWRRRLGGISGDCLGASVEVSESLLLLALVLLGGVEPSLP